jgi:hypothetical protein
MKMEFYCVECRVEGQRLDSMASFDAISGRWNAHLALGRLLPSANPDSISITLRERCPRLGNSSSSQGLKADTARGGRSRTAAFIIIVVK